MSALPFRLSLSTGSLYHFPMNTIFALAHDLGLDGVELVIGPECLLRGPQYVLKLSARYQMPILSLHPPIIPLPGWGKAAVMFPRLTEWACALGRASNPAPILVTVHAPHTDSLASERGQRYVSAITRLAASLAALGACLAIENRARFHHNEAPQCLDNPASLRSFAASLGAGITFDTAHAGSLYADLLAAYDALAPAVRNIHLSDLRSFPWTPAAYFSHTLFKHHQLPGDGHLPLDRLLQRLQRHTYSGLLTLECSPLALQAWHPRRVYQRLAAALEYIRVWTDPRLHPTSQDIGTVLQ